MIRFLALVFLSVSCLTSLSAQSLQWVKGDTLVEKNAYSVSALIATASIKNTSNQSLSVQVTQRVLDQNDLLDSNAFFWGISYPFNVNQSAIAIDIPANGTDSVNFYSYIQQDGDGVPHTGRIAYTFYDEANIADSLQIIIRYTVGPDIGMPKEIRKEDQLYPNPAVDFISFKTDYQILSVIAIDLLGNEFLLNEESGRIDITKLKQGVYIVKVVLNNNSTIMNRFIKL